jgi:hypothetical protein
MLFNKNSPHANFRRSTVMVEVQGSEFKAFFHVKLWKSLKRNLKLQKVKT